MRDAQQAAVPAGPSRPRLVEWLAQERQRRGALTVGLVTPHRIAPYVRDVGFHAIIRNRTSIADLHRMIERLGASYVILPTSPRGWYILRKRSQFYRGFTAVAELDELTIWAPLPFVGEAA
jgi:hypothetical protein